MKAKYWPIVRLDDIKAEKKYALNCGPFGSKLVSRDYIADGVPVIRGTNLTGDSSFSFDNFVFVSEEKANKLMPNNAHPGDLIFTQRGTLGQVGIIPKNCSYKRFVVSQSQMKLTVDETKAIPYFLYCYFRAPNIIKTIHNLAISSGVPHINLDILRNFQVLLPPLPIQRKIAAILSTYDDLIENNTRRIKILEEMARSLYREWFINFRFPRHEQVKMVDSELGLIPEGWHLTSLGTHIKTQKGYAFKSSWYQDSGVKIVKVSNFTEDSININDLVSISEEVAQNYSKHELKANDIIIQTVGSWPSNPQSVVGKVIRVPKIAAKSLLNQNAVKLIPLPSVNQFFLFYSLKNDIFQKNIIGCAQGAASQASITLESINNFDFLLPSLETMKLFQEFVEPIWLSINNLINKNLNLRRTRDLLLPKLISGEIDVENLDINTGEIAA